MRTVVAYGGVEAYLHSFLASWLVGGKWSASRPFTAAKEPPVSNEQMAR
jgi:hypothetical protein